MIVTVPIVGMHATVVSGGAQRGYADRAIAHVIPKRHLPFGSRALGAGRLKTRYDISSICCRFDRSWCPCELRAHPAYCFDMLHVRKGNLEFLMPNRVWLAAVLAFGTLSAGTSSVMAGSCKLYEAVARLSAPMTFVRIATVPHKVLIPWSKEGEVNETGIMAEGRIVAGTSDRLRSFLQSNPLPPGTPIYLSSPGGNLGEGLNLGSLIRQHRFDTVIGSDRILVPSGYPRPVIGPSGCLSSCTFAFLGGVDRRMLSDDLYGVHRFYSTGPTSPATAEEDAQITTAALFGYVRSMGVDPGLIEEMVKEGKTAVNALSKDRLAALRVLTTTDSPPIWPLMGSPEWTSCTNPEPAIDLKTLLRK
jgi:hypothetical protein